MNHAGTRRTPNTSSLLINSDQQPYLQAQGPGAIQSFRGRIASHDQMSQRPREPIRTRAGSPERLLSVETAVASNRASPESARVIFRGERGYRVSPLRYPRPYHQRGMPKPHTTVPSPGMFRTPALLSLKYYTRSDQCPTDSQLVSPQGGHNRPLVRGLQTFHTSKSR